ncbi:hypothetical protein HID58_007948, partial [Brassica napus]
SVFGRRVSVRAVAGARLLPSSSFIFFFLHRPSMIVFVWRKDAVGLGAGVSNLVRSFVVLIPGDGSYSSSVVAGFSPGGGGFLRSTDAGFSSREKETYSAPSSPALGSGGWKLSKLCPVGYETRCLVVVDLVGAVSVVRGFLLADEISKSSMKLSAEWLSVEGKFGFGGGSRYLSSDELRCMVVVLRRCSDAAMVKSKHR